MKISEGERWFPKRISFAFGEPVVEIVMTNQSVNRFFSDLDLAHPKKSVLIPLMDIQLPDLVDKLSPAGFLFHTPRSGSTLVAQMLAIPEKHVVLVEPEPVNALLSYSSCKDVDFRWLRQLIHLYMLAFSRECSALFVKTTSWAILKLPLFEAAFPLTPVCMIYRNPVEVMVQILQRRTGWMADQARTFILDIDERESARMSLEMYAAEALVRFFNAAALAHSRMLLIAYECLPEAVTDHLLEHFRIKTNINERQSMIAQGALDSEDWGGHSRYADDSALMQSYATEKIKLLEKEIILPALLQLKSQANDNGNFKAI